MADYLNGKPYISYGGKDYLEKQYASAVKKEKIRPKKQDTILDKQTYPFRCYCTEKFRYIHELKKHRKEANHPLITPDVPQKI